MTPLNPLTEPSPPAQFRRRALASSLLRVTAQLAQVALGIGSTMLLARLLAPADFGLLAMVGSFTAFVGSFRDFGLPSATAHQAVVTHQQLSALFWLNLRRNLVLVLLMAAMAPILAWFYRETRLIPITLAMAAAIGVLGLSTQHEALLTREMRFGALAAVELGSSLTGILVAVLLAAHGAQYWALVAQLVVTLLIKSAATCLASAWWPTRDPHPSGAQFPDLRAILTYSRHVTWSRVIAHIGRNLDRVLIGYLGGPAAMGLYDKSYRWSIFPITTLFNPLLAVGVASLSRVRDDPAMYRGMCHALLMPVFALTLPILAFMAVEAPSVVALLLGSGWLDAVLLFRLLSIAAFFSSLSTATKLIYLSLGDTRRQLQWGLLSAPVMIIATILGSRWGAYGVALGFTLAASLLAGPSVLFCLRTSWLTVRDFLAIVWRPALASVIAAALLVAGRPLIASAAGLLVLPTRLGLFGLSSARAALRTMSILRLPRTDPHDLPVSGA